MEKKKILVIDDEKDMRDMVKANLDLAGYMCLTAKDGKKGMEVAKTKSPSLIILDLVMPGIDGVKLYKMLKADGQTRHIPIIVYTAQAPEIVAKKGMKAFDILDFVIKPSDAKTLLLAVKKALNNPR